MSVDLCVYVHQPDVSVTCLPSPKLRALIDRIIRRTSQQTIFGIDPQTEMALREVLVEEIRALFKVKV